MSVWKRIALGDFAKSVEYGVTAAATLQPVGPKFLRITDIQDGAVNWDTVPWCECDARSVIDSRLQAGDIVFARTGATTGKSFLIRDCPPDAVFASYLIRVRLGDEADPRYVSHFFQTRDYWAQITKGARGVAQPGVNATTLKAVQVPLPPVAEQKRIAEVLDRADTLRARRRAALTRIDTLTQALFLDLFGDPATNPKGWPVKPFGDEIDSVRYGTGSPPNYVEEGVPFIRATNVKRGTISSKDLKRISPGDAAELAKCKVSFGDLIVVRSGVNTGDCAIVPPEYHGACAAFDLIVELSGANSVFYNFLINSPYGKRHLAPLTRRAAQPHLNAEQLRALAFIAPPQPLRDKFVRRVAAVEKLRTAHSASLTEMDVLFAGLQHLAFRGEL